jgi:hypothetical protein
MDSLVHHLQLGVIAAAVFFCLWGVATFGPCLVRVLKGVDSAPRIGHRLCMYHASTALVCVAALFFAMSRLDVLTSWSGGVVAGWMWMAGMLTFFMKLGISSWALARERAKLKMPTAQSLSWIFAMQLIIIMAFILVGLLGEM